MAGTVPASPVSAPVGRKLASTASTYALTCTTPRLTNTGTKFRDTIRTCSDVRSHTNRRSGATRNTIGTCTANCSALPTTEPQASISASRGSSRAPKATRVAIIAAFHITGAAYDSRNRW